jgi:mannan endo-1,4-beta-mannosidase
VVLLCAVCIVGAADNFSVKDGKIYDPQGREFIIRGCNVQSWNQCWEGTVAEQMPQLIDCWRFNFARCYARLYKTGCTWPKHTKSEYYRLLDSLTNRGVVASVCFWDKLGGYFSGGSLNDLNREMKELAIHYKDNPYVWFETMNEPGGSGSNKSAWLNVHHSVIKTIRGAGNGNIISCSDDHWGQGAGGGSGSAVRKWGDEVFTADGKKYDNIIFTFHVYDQWKGGPESRARSYFDFHRKNGWVTWIGEYGVDNVGSNTQGATAGVIKVAKEYGIGRVVWSWYGGDDNKLFEGANLVTEKAGWRGAAIDMTTCDSDNPTANGVTDLVDFITTPGDSSYPLTWLGKLVWDDNHSVPAVSSPASSLKQETVTGGHAVVGTHGQTIRIDLKSRPASRITLYSINGIPIVSKKCGAQSRSVEFRNIVPGSYILQIADRNGEETLPICTGKF